MVPRADANEPGRSRRFSGTLGVSQSRPQLVLAGRTNVPSELDVPGGASSSLLRPESGARGSAGAVATRSAGVTCVRWSSPVAEEDGPGTDSDGQGQDSDLRKLPVRKGRVVHGAVDLPSEKIF